MNTRTAEPELERELPPLAIDSGALSVISKAEIDVQITTAHRFPRSVSKFVEEATSLVTLTEAIAEECIYALPRDGKTIEGPSARFAEIIASCWGNSRAGARVVDEAGQFVTAQGVFHDLQKNVAITYEVKRRIVDKNGRRYNPDMIGVTANAACSIALRNAILKGVPKAFWTSIYDTARKTIIGDFQTLANRRAAALQAFQKFGVKPEQVFEKLGIRGEEDITLDHVLVLRGLMTALKEGDTTVEDAFAPKPAEGERRGAGASLKEAVAGAKKPDAKAKPAGTAEQRDKFIGALKGCTDLEVLALKMDEANLHEWQSDDLKAIEEAFKARKFDLMRGGPSLADHIAKLDELADADAISAYAEKLSHDIVGDERFAKAVKKRLNAIKDKRK